MFFTNSKKINLTILFSVVLALVLVSGSQAKSFAAAAEPPARREHENLKRIVKKRSPQLFGVVGDTTATASTTAVTTTTTSRGGGIGGIISDVLGGGKRTTTAPPTTTQLSTTAPPSTTSAPTTTSTPTSITPPPTPTPLPVDTGVPTVVVTTEVEAPSAQATDIPARNAQMQKTVTTVLIVIASVVGGTAIIWTIIRKWKFRPSDSFEDRMQPIDWQPTTGEPSGLPTRRLSVASSFHSGGHGSDDHLAPHHGMGAGSGGGYSDSNLGMPGVAPYSDHDLTATPAHLGAPVGGYADLSRGPSPAPQMQEAGHGGVGYQPYSGTQDPYDYNGPRY